ncbi:hypothetical protein [Novosphingobium resinovorum]|uniref:Uncharacterized protein n=1 Tax=Novosphingobium resinovorum TaxID=158500 RepID=A0A1D8ADT6_9SPHN|nr:hypothetical protein [Novosphingobium resinovorum]AOR80288.1 hypothetical protein BES08_25625 [Novosphingobium resinovorum]
MVRKRLGLVAASAAGVLAFIVPVQAQDLAQIRIEDVARFYRVYDEARGAPSARVLQQDYIEAGSDGFVSLYRTGSSPGPRWRRSFSRTVPSTTRLEHV